MKQWLVRTAVAAAALAVSTGCVSYPIVKPDAFNPKPKVAIVSYQSEIIADGTLGLPIKIAGIDQSYAQFQKALADNQFELVPLEQIRNCPDYFKLPRPLVDMGTSARGLERVILSSQNAAGLARCVGADIVVSVTAQPQIVAGFQVAGIGTSKVRMHTEVHAYDNDGQEIWLDRLQTESEGFKVAGSVMDPGDVDRAGVAALSDASAQAVSRFMARLAATAAPAPAAPQTATPAPH